MIFIEVVVFILIKNNKILLEKRKQSKEYDSEKIVIPGGLVEKGELNEIAMQRELQEELNLKTKNYDYLCTLLQKEKKAIIKIHYYAVHIWSGQIENNEVKELLWISLDDLTSLSLDVDKVAIQEYQRFFIRKL